MLTLVVKTQAGAYVCVDEYMKHRLELKLIHSIIVALK